MFRNKITISPLLLRLLTLNILALFFVLGGLISIDRYQQTLQENEFKKLEDEGKRGRKSSVGQAGSDNTTLQNNGSRMRKRCEGYYRTDAGQD